MTSIGIAMALKNVSGGLDHAIASLRAFGVTEIAVSDASGDPSVRKRFAPVEDLISNYFAGPDSGQSHGLDRAFRALSSPIVGWLNHDDYLVRDGAAGIAAAIADHDVVYGEAQFMDMRGAVVGYHPNVSSNLDRIARENTIAQPSCFFRKSLYEEVGGLDYDLHYTMDWDLWIKMNQAGASIKYIPRLLSGVTLDPAAKTAQPSLQRAREIMGFLDRSGATFRERANLITESMKTAALWRLRRQGAPHPYFTGWSHHGGPRRAPEVAGERHAQIFSLRPVPAGEVKVWRRGAENEQQAISLRTVGANAFAPLCLDLPFGLNDLSRVRAGPDVQL